MKNLIAKLQNQGWLFEPPSAQDPTGFPERYPPPPEELAQFARSFSVLCSPDETRWFLSPRDYRAEQPGGFSWNAFETMSLEAFSEEPALEAQIIHFWTAHLPLFMSVKGGYAYGAYCFSGNNAGNYVCGTAPEFEETSVIGQGLQDLQQWVLDGKYP